jgi:hypothetical protein
VTSNAGAGLVVNFGTNRAPLVRARTVAMAEVAGGERRPGRRQTQSRSLTELSVRLTGDLRAAGGSHAELPSSQVTVGSTRLSGQRVSITAAVEPGQPEEVPAGCYVGRILVVSDTGRASLPILVDLGDREGRRATGAFLVLLTGAGLGLTIKWITESLTPLAAQRRRLDRLRRRLGIDQRQDDVVLPVKAQVLLDEAEDRIERNDIVGLDAVIQPLEAHLPALISVASTLGRLRRKIQAHEDIAAGRKFAKELPKDWRSRVERLTAVELERVEDIRQMDWPDDGDATADAIEDLRSDFLVIEDFLDALVRTPQSPDLARMFRALVNGDYDEVRNDLRSRPDLADSAPPATPGAAPSSTSMYDNDFIHSTWRPQLHRRGERSWLMSLVMARARMFAALASVLIVALIGLQLQYLDPVDFDDSLGDWLTLFLWGLAVELSGVSVLDVVSRLGNAGMAQARPTA